MRYPAIIEQPMFFELPDSGGKRIKGVLRGTLGGQQPLAILMHGRPGNGNELLQYLGARYLAEQGITTLRLWMYDFEPHTRSIMDCTLQTHVADFTAVVQALSRQGIKQVFAVGHSYGGLTILGSQVELAGAVLWDPAHGLWWQDGRSKVSAQKYPEKIVNEYVVGTAGSGWMYPTAALEYDQQLGDTTAWAAKEYPLLVVSAGAGKLTDLGTRYVRAARGVKKQVVIEDAHHNFEDSDQVMQRLFAETAAWIAKYS